MRALLLAIKWTMRNGVPFRVNYQMAKVRLKGNQPWWTIRIDIDELLMFLIGVTLWALIIAAIIIVALVMMEAVLRLYPGG